MKRLISNSLNEKSVINNILSGTLNKVILLTGPFGTGKTEFSKQIARMLTCESLTVGGYCGECGPCKTDIVHGINSFNASIHLLNMETVGYDDMVTLVGQATQKVRSRNEVYILDEFHLVDKKAQELWLGETSKLEDSYLILTTTDKKAISDGIISRSIQINMERLAPLEAAQLVREYYPEATQEIISAIVKKVGGSPRELINNSIYYANSGLGLDEIKDHLSGAGQQEILLCLESMTNRELFFEALKTVRSMNYYTVKTALQDILWDWIGATASERAKMTYLSKFTESQIMKFIITSNQDPMMTILNMFNAVTIKPPMEVERALRRTPPTTSPNSQPGSIGKTEERWQ